MNLIAGDCLEVMAGMDPESVDAVVTDPPYGLEFMGQEWDRLGDVGTTSHAGPAAKAAGERGQYGRVTNFGSSNVKCRACGKWQWDHVGRKCVCERPDFPSVSRHQGVLMGEWHARWAEAAYRVAKPSAYLLAFGGTRTVHRMTVALEDAGWIIRDMLVWAYASGFPKSRASLKPSYEPIVMARKPGPLRMLAIDACRIGTDDDRPAGGPIEPGPSLIAYGDGLNTAAPKPPSPLGRWPANVILTDPVFDGGIEGVVGGGETQRGIASENSGGWGRWFGDESNGSAGGYGDSGTYSRFFQIPRGETCDWCGARLAAPSSYQPSPSDGSAPSPVATGAFDESSTTTDSRPTSGTETPSWLDGSATTPPTPRSKRRGTSPASGRRSSPARSPDAASPAIAITTTTGVLSTCVTCAEVITSGSTSPDRNYPWAYLIPKADRSDREPVLGGLPTTYKARRGAAWEWRCSKCGRQRQNVPGAACECAEPQWVNTPQTPRANVHPTVKPVDLMRHLVRLVTPTGGVVLDPFLGSGTTALAAEMEGFEWIGIEREAEYVAIAEARLNGTQRGLGLPA